MVKKYLVLETKIKKKRKDKKKNLVSKQYHFIHFQTQKKRILRIMKTQHKYANKILIKGNKTTTSTTLWN